MSTGNDPEVAMEYWLMRRDADGKETVVVCTDDRANAERHLRECQRTARQHGDRETFRIMERKPDA